MSDGTLALRALVVDDEAPAREELAFLLRDDPRVAETRLAGSAAEALRIMADQPIDVIFCDIKMPGLDGVELARLVGRFVDRPQVVFVTAYDDRAVDAFELQAVDYLMKPVHADRLAEAVRRAVTAGSAEHADEPDETIPVELAGVTRFVRRSQIRFAEAHGDYVRLHTAGESHLLRATLGDLEQRWAATFVRIHRSTLVALAHIDEVRTVDGRSAIRIGDVELPVSRRHSREVRERLMARA